MKGGGNPPSGIHIWSIGIGHCIGGVGFPFAFDCFCVDFVVVAARKLDDGGGGKIGCVEVEVEVEDLAVPCNQMQASWTKSSPPRTGRAKTGALGLIGAAAGGEGAVNLVLALALAFDLALDLGTKTGKITTGGTDNVEGACSPSGSVSHSPSTSLRYILRASS